MRSKYIRKSEIVLQKTAMQMILEERQRQIAKGYTPEHDQQWKRFELRKAAECYERAFFQRFWKREGPPRKWPWHPEKWQPLPEDRQQEWIIAAALNLAEAERREFAGETSKVARLKLKQIAGKLDSWLKDEVIRFQRQENFQKWCTPRKGAAEK